MPRIALLYDVHGNLPALDEVLDDALRADVEHFVLGGDYALFGAWPVETVERLRALRQATWIRGNGERWSAAPSEAPQDDVVQGAISACRAALGGELIAELSDLPEQTVGDGTRFCHASPLSDVRSFAPAPGEDDQELMAGVSERRLVFGHTHLPFQRLGPGGVQLLNPGSIGMPFDGDTRAAYAVIDDQGVEHRRVAYDYERSAAAVRERFGSGAWTETVARRIVTARL